jgi:hypothetical protein
MLLRSATGLALLALAGCVQAPVTSGLSISPTEVAVDPADFLHGVDCSNNPGAMRSFVVTLSVFDDANDTTPFILPSTLPTPCSTEAGLQTMVVPGKLYIADVDGYNEPTSAMNPFGGASSGSRQMVDAKGAFVTPRWTTRCGLSAASATMALVDRTSYIRNCEPLVDRQPSATALRVDPKNILGANPCTVATTLDVDVLLGSLAPITGMSCSAPPADLSVVAGASYRLYAHAKRLDGTTVGAECSAIGEPGEIVTPVCDALSDKGSAIIDLSGVMKSGKPACAAGLFFDVVSQGGSLNELPFSCSATAQVGPLAPGITNFSIVVYDKNGKPAQGGASCGADIAPGRMVKAICL